MICETGVHGGLPAIAPVESGDAKSTCFGVIFISSAGANPGMNAPAARGTTNPAPQGKTWLQQHTCWNHLHDHMFYCCYAFACELRSPQISTYATMSCLLVGDAHPHPSGAPIDLGVLRVALSSPRKMEWGDVVNDFVDQITLWTTPAETNLFIDQFFAINLESKMQPCFSNHAIQINRWWVGRRLHG